MTQLMEVTASIRAVTVKMKFLVTKKTGKCPSGCASGYEGIYCNKSKLQEYSANL